MASRLRPALRDSDTFARFGGDEFAVVAPDIAGPAGAADLAQRLIQPMAEPFHVSDGEVQIGVSIGVALFPQGSDDPDQPITRVQRSSAKHEPRAGPVLRPRSTPKCNAASSSGGVAPRAGRR